MSFPDNFLWGASSSAAQIEGAWNTDGKTPSIWDTADPRHLKNGETCHEACDHYHHWQEDIALMKTIGLKSYRFSVSWPRIIPEKGTINEKGLSFYRNLIKELKKNGIEPLITLYHWDLPVWVDKEGGWKSPKIIDYYLDYVKVVIDSFSDDVCYWITFNEPQVFIMMAYVMGSYAPFRHNVFTFKNHLRHMLLAHGKTVRLIRETARTTPKIGIAMAATTYIPDDDSPEALADARRKSFESRVGEGSNSLYADPICLGKPSKMMQGKLTDDDLKIISEPIDFIGVNVYQPSNPMLDKDKYNNDCFPKSSLGWVVDGRCLYWTIRHYWDRYHIPVMVTENGIALNDTVSPDGHIHDTERISFLHAFLPGVRKAIEEGIPVLGYQHWSIMDNYEWCEGYSPRFGLVHVDYASQKRTLKDSAMEYACIIKSNGEIL